MSEQALDVVVVTHNSARTLGAALRALPPEADVVVVDNRSDDGSAEVARSAGARVILADSNAGFAASANRGAAAGVADHILFLNPDATVDEVSLRRLRRAVDERGVAVVGPRLTTADDGTQRASWPFPSAPGAWREALGLHRIRARQAHAEFVVGACFLVRRSVFEALGGFDTRFWLYGEETDLCRRAIDAGWHVELVEGASATHVGGASGAGKSALVFEHFNRGVEHYTRKHHGRAALVSIRAAQVVGSVIRLATPGDPARRRYHRDRLARLRTLLARQPLSVPLDSPATTERGLGLVVCSLEAWDDVWRRNQFFVRELLRLHPDRRVLFVEPSFDWLHELRGARDRSRRRGLRPLTEDARIVLFEPSKLWPRVAGPWAERSLRAQVHRAATRLGLDEPTLWVNDPGYAGLATATRWPAVYDITDDWSEAAGPPRIQRRVVQREAALFRECARVIVCSEGLASSRRAARHDLVVVPNGVDREHFARPRPRPEDLPAAPTAVYVGTLHEDRLDVDLVELVAQKLPELQVVLVGPSSLGAGSCARLDAAPNVHLLGARPYRDVPAYLQHADVVIVPHVVSSFTESLDPIKAYECLAVGRPTVATPVAGFRGLGEPVRTASADAFVAAVERARQGPPPAARPDVPSWADRAAAFDEQLQQARADAPVPRPRVAFVNHCAQLSGGELALARVLPALGGVEAVVILGEHGLLEDRLREADATVEVLPLDPDVATTNRHEVTAAALGLRRVASTARYTWQLRRRLRALDIDLVHTNSLKAALYGGFAGRLAGIPVVWHVRDRIAADYLPRPVVLAIRGLARVIPTAVIANSNATLDTVGHFRRSRVVASPVVYDAVPVIRHERAVARDLFRVSMVGRLAPWKGQHLFLEALARAFGDDPFKATIVGSAMFGEDEYAAQLEHLVDELGLRERVTLTGFVHDVGAELAATDCLVHASVLAEPFGQVVIEGMAAGLPVIASAAGGPLEIVTDGVDGLLFPPGDAEALAVRLRLLCEDPDLRARLGAAALERSRDFSPERVAAEIDAVYRSVLRGRRS